LVTDGDDAIERMSFFLLFPTTAFDDDDPDSVSTQSSSE
jgi:hypothetical protein